MDKPQLRQFRAALVETDVPLAPGDTRYVPGLHGTPQEDVISALLESILIYPDTSTRLFYFTGQRGTGKSTELRRLEQLLLGEEAQVVRFDSMDFLAETEMVTAEGLLLVVAAGLATWADEYYTADFLSSSAWQRFAGWLKSDVKLVDVTAHGLKRTLKAQQVPVAQRIHDLAAPMDWVQQVQAFAQDLVAFIRKRTRRERVVVIVDSLERLRGVTSAGQDAMLQHIVTTFAGDLERLKVPSASVVYAVPPCLTLMSDVRSRVTCHTLASVRVHGQPLAHGHRSDQRRQPRPEGLEKMRSLIERRHAAWAQVLDAEALNALALASGGDLRHFMHRLVSGVAGQALFALNRLPLRADDAIIQRVIHDNRGETERLTVKSEWPLLADIARSHNAIATDRQESLRTLARLLDARVILNYHNGTEWFDIHPLLWPLIDRYSERLTPTAPKPPEPPARPRDVP